MRSGSEPTLWSSCFFFFTTMSVITRQLPKDQLDMAKNSPERTSTRCFKMIATNVSGVLTELPAEFSTFVSFKGSCHYSQQTRLWAL